jgi:CheY-like chemotaxis protein
MAAAQTTRILVVEEDANVRQSLAEVLRRAGFEVDTAGAGQEALELLRQAAPPNLILLNPVMPVIDGWQFLEALRQDGTLSGIPFMIVSGCDAARVQAAALGAVGLLSRPIALEQLVATLRGFTTPVRNGILIVDDEPAVCALLQMALEDSGFTVWQASNGRTAVDLYRSHCAAIGMVLLDVRMPGQDGPATLTALKQINPLLRSCFMSGHTGDYSPEDLLAMGAQHVFQKPLGIAELVRLLQRWLAEPAAQA